MQNHILEKAKTYQRTRQILTLIHITYMVLMLVFLVFAPLTVHFRDAAVKISSRHEAVLAFYFLYLSIFIFIFDFPFSFYSGYLLEKKYNLSNHTVLSWTKDFLKSGTLSFGLSLCLLEVLYLLMRVSPGFWWVWAWAAYAFFGYVLGKIFPVWIIPLFYRYQPVKDEEIRNRILRLAERYRMPIENIFSLNLSRTTKKANAAFMGIGKTKRVVLSDTLLAQFSPDEIESVVAHELGHYRHKDIWRQMGVGLVVSFFSFWFVYAVMKNLVFPLGFDGIADAAGMPLLFLAFYLTSLFWMPAGNAFSRYLERAADKFALTATQNKEAFMAVMRKLAELNLSDPSPNVVYEWFFYDHPSIEKRVRFAENWQEEKKL